jgi:acyl carrier protein
MSQPIEQRVRQVASDVFNIPAAQITAESSPETIETWDSVQHLNLVLALEQELGVSIEPEEIEKMKSIGDVITLMQQKSAGT